VSTPDDAPIAEARELPFSAREAYTPDEGIGGDGDGFGILERARAEAGHMPAVRELLDGIDRWIEDGVADGRARPLQAYLRLPTTASKVRLYIRNVWLARAAAWIDARGPWHGCTRLAEEWETFCTRGGWQAMRALERPPAEVTSELRRALFHASKHHGDEPTLGAHGLRRIERVLSVWRE